MSRKRRVKVVPLETIWAVPDTVWEIVEAILETTYPKAKTGRPRVDLRLAMNGMIFQLRTGCQWNQLPKVFGDDSSVHRWFQRWVQDNVFEALWAILINECDDLQGVDWEWQAADCCLGKSRMGGDKRGRIQRIEQNPEPRRASWSKPTAAP